MSFRKRNIACLESLWDDRTENRLNVVPMLEIISRSWNVKFSHLTCNTREELKYNLNLLCKRNYGILYLAFHGAPGVVRLHGNDVTLTELTELMRSRFKNWIIHFGSCETLRKPKEVNYFVEQTGAAMVTGFTRSIGWVEAAAFELLLFQAFHSFQSPKVVCRNILKKHQNLVEITGFKFFPNDC